MNLNSDNLRHINSMTKYPSIPTYFGMGERGILKESERVTMDSDFTILTEKINGTNCRILVYPDGDFVIGSREELLFARGDRVPNPTLGIVSAVQGLALILAVDFEHDLPTVYYGEVFGAGIEGGKEYGKKEVGFALFDIMRLPDYAAMLSWPLEKVASWRDHGGQEYLSHNDMLESAKALDVQTVPVLGSVNTVHLPKTIAEGLELLQATTPNTQIKLDRETLGKSEGIVLKSANAGNRVLAKLRYEDINRTIRSQTPREPKQKRESKREA